MPFTNNMNSIKWIVSLLLTATWLLLSLPAMADDKEHGQSDEGVIHVSSRASVQVEPDRALLRLGVKTEVASARNAMNRNAQMMARLLAAVRRYDIPDRQIKTSQLSLKQRYKRVNREQEFSHYEAVNRVTITLHNFDILPELLADAIDAGANVADGLQFVLSDPEPYRMQVMAEAARQLEEKAQIIANAMGRTLAGAVRISEGGVAARRKGSAFRSSQLQPMSLASSGGGVVAPPVRAGEIEISVSLEGAFRLNPLP